MEKLFLQTNNKNTNPMFDSKSITKFDFNDILIQPSVTTDIVSRTEVVPYADNSIYTYGKSDKGVYIGKLPLFASPMDTVINEKNAMFFVDNKLAVCLPRGIKKYSTNFHIFASVSLDEFVNEYISKNGSVYSEFHFNEFSSVTLGHDKFYVLIDIANGHMKKMEEAIIEAKKIYGNKIFIMAGNVAHPKTYRKLSEAGADAIRIGIGNGNGCLTTEQTGVGFPMASLIRECYHASLMMENPALIIADGGMKNYSDIIKALALGADSVMLGSILNKSLESAGPTYLFKKIKVNPQGKFAKWAFDKGFTLTKKFRGMSTKEVQKDWGADKIKTSEGVVRFRPVEYTLAQWTENFESYLRSAMSYCNAKTLKEFREHAQINFITDNSFKRFNK